MDLIPLLARAQATLARAVGAVLHGRSPRPADLPSLATARRILVVRLDELGDVVLSTAFLRELRRAAPTARIALVVQPGIAHAVSRLPYVDEVVAYDVRCHPWLRPFLLPLRALHFARTRLRALGADVVLLPRWDADQCYATMLAHFTGARWRIGYSERVNRYRRRINAGFDALLSHALDEGGQRHEVERSLALLRWLGATPEDARLELRWDEEDERAASALLPAASRGETRWVALCPSFGHSPLKQWPIEHFVELARQLTADPAVRILLVGGAADVGLAARIHAAIPGRATNATGATTLRQLAALLHRCDLFVGSDTGVMHVAAAAGVPVIGLFGASHRLRFAPWPGEVLSLDLPCSPLRRSPEEDRCRRCVLDRPRCMHDLSPTRVADAARRSLDLAPGTTATLRGG